MKALKLKKRKKKCKIVSSKVKRKVFELNVNKFNIKLCSTRSNEQMTRKEHNQFSINSYKNQAMNH